MGPMRRIGPPGRRIAAWYRRRRGGGRALSVTLWVRTPIGRMTGWTDWPQYRERYGRDRPMDFWSRRGVMLSFALRFVPRDFWVGVYYGGRDTSGSGGPLSRLYTVFICVVPMFPLVVTLGLPKVLADLRHGAIERDPKTGKPR